MEKLDQDVGERKCGRGCVCVCVCVYVCVCFCKCCCDAFESEMNAFLCPAGCECERKEGECALNGEK